jgi:1-acyl-sn-glycerol-3-phosphate acyltransferase
MVIGVAPRASHFLVKKEAFVGPLGPFMTRVGQIKVDRDTTDRTAITHALGVLENGGVLGIFPEGTRGEGDFASLRAGLAYFAVRAGAPIVPVAVIGPEEEAPLLANPRWLARLVGTPVAPISPALVFPFPVKYRIHFGTPLRFRGPATADAVTRHVASVRVTLQELIRSGLAMRRHVFF